MLWKIYKTALVVATVAIVNVKNVIVTVSVNVTQTK